MNKAFQLMSLLEEADPRIWSPKSIRSKKELEFYTDAKEPEQSNLTNKKTIVDNFNQHLTATYYPHIYCTECSYGKDSVDIKFKNLESGEKLNYSFYYDEQMLPYVSGTYIHDEMCLSRTNVPRVMEGLKSFVAFYKLDWILYPILEAMFGLPKVNYPTKVSNTGYTGLSRTYDAYGNIAPRGK